jgi:iron complex transport system substrate-binding protein
MLADLGCINIADSDTQLLENLSVEAVLAEEPHHIFIVTMGADSAAAMQSVENMLHGHPAWQTLDAVKSGRLHIMDRALFHLKPNARWAEAYRTLYEVFIEE